jgi:glutamyl-tRNA reductase
MGQLTLRHLRTLQPRRILVTNRSPEKARQVAQGCGGEAVPWDQLDEVLARADIVLSTTGAPEPIMTYERYRRIAARRTAGCVVILDLAVPRDFDQRIHDGDRTCLFNLDDLGRIREATLGRSQHIAPAEAIVEQEAQRFSKDWARRRNGPVIDRLTRDIEQKREEILKRLFARLNGKLTEVNKEVIAAALRRFQNRLLHGPISALSEETHNESAGGHTLLEALRKLFRLQE